MTAMPGTPAIQNAIPIPYYGTNVFAAPGLGIIASLIMLGGGLWWLQSRVNKAKLEGRGYGVHEEDMELPETKDLEPKKGALSTMPLSLALLPLVLVIGVNALFTYFIFPNTDFSPITDRYPELNPKNMAGLWSLIIALVVACATLVAIRLGRWENLKESINQGVFGCMLPLFNTASEVGYGAVIATLAGFAIIRDTVLNLTPTNPLISEAIAMNVLAGITGSSSGGLSIALQTLGQDYLAMAEQAGISPELMHRVAVMAAGGFDTLPHCGAIITLLAICRLNHRQAYGNIAMVTMVAPLFALISVITLGTLFGNF